MRIACLWIPDLPLVAALRAEPALCSTPLAVVQAAAGAQGEADGRARVLAATEQAEGVRAGQTLAEARALCPDLRVRVASPERVRAAAQAAVDAAASLTPRLEEAGPGLVYLDVEGLESLVGDDAAVAGALHAAAGRVGLCAAIGLAEGKLGARLVARAAAQGCAPRATRAGVGGGSACVVARGEQAAFLAGLPLDEALADAAPWLLPPGARLDPDEAERRVEELVRACRRFGLRTLGELVRLPVGPLSARLGPEGAALHRLARGEDTHPLLAQPLPERFEEGEELEWAAGSLEPLIFLWKSLLDRLGARLSARGLAASVLLLRLRLEGGAWDERALELAGPTREVGPLLKLLQLELEARPPGEGVCAVRLTALPAKEACEQLALFGPRTASPAQLAAALARVAALVGPEGVGRPVVVDRHAPFAAARERFAPPPAPALLAAAAPGAQAELPLCARALRPPRTAEVRCDAQGTPKLLIGEGALGGRVLACAGPWRTEAEWWTAAPLALDSYDLELAGGLLVRASQELETGRWWVEAVYD